MNSRCIAVQYALASRRGIPAATGFRRWAEAALAELHSAASLTIRLVETAEIHDLNRRYRQRDQPTNVLSFPLPEHLQLQHGVLGDVLICPHIAAAEAQQQHKRLPDHLAHLTVHGVLHLQGHDHVDADEAETMESAERRILATLGIADPYLIR